MIDIHSDNIIEPSTEMKRKMFSAKSVHTELEDFSVKELIQKACAILEKEDGIFLPSGTMANEIAFLTHCYPNGRVILDKYSEPMLTMQGGISSYLGVQFHAIDAIRGIIKPYQLNDLLNDYPSASVRDIKLVSIEQSAAERGGTTWGLNDLSELYESANKSNLKIHMDGARLFNAAAYTKTSPAENVRYVDSVYIDLAKGLGAPTGALLMGSKNFIKQAWEWKWRLGATLRKVGMLAEAGIYALDNYVEKIEKSNENALLLYSMLMEEKDVVIPKPETNILFVNIEGLGVNAKILYEELLKEGLRVSYTFNNIIRLVTNSEIHYTELEEVSMIFKQTILRIKKRGCI